MEKKEGRVAQLVERAVDNGKAVGSKPTSPRSMKKKKGRKGKGWRKKEKMSGSKNQRRKSLGAYTTSGDRREIQVDVDQLITRMKVCRDHTGLQYKLLTDVTAVDYPERTKRFDVIYNRLSVRYGRRLLVK